MGLKSSEFGLKKKFPEFPISASGSYKDHTIKSRTGSKFMAFHNHNNIFENKIATRSDEIVYRMISPEKPDPTAVFVPDNKQLPTWLAKIVNILIVLGALLSILACPIWVHPH